MKFERSKEWWAKRIKQLEGDRMEDKIEEMAFAMFTADTGEASLEAWKAFPNKDRYMRMANAAYWIAVSTVEEVHNGPLLQKRAKALAGVKE